MHLHQHRCVAYPGDRGFFFIQCIGPQCRAIVFSQCWCTVAAAKVRAKTAQQKRHSNVESALGQFAFDVGEQTFFVQGGFGKVCHGVFASLCDLNE